MTCVIDSIDSIETTFVWVDMADNHKICPIVEEKKKYIDIYIFCICNASMCSYFVKQFELIHFFKFCFT